MAVFPGADCEKICFHGNNKTDEELEYAVEMKVGRIIVDNVYELERLDKIAEKKRVKAGIMFRIKPGIDAHTHDFIRTGQIDSKFGFALETGEAMEAVKKALSCENINLKGLHCHIGSQIFDIDPFTEAAKVMLTFISDIKNETGHEIIELNLGAGFDRRIKLADRHNVQAYSLFLHDSAHFKTAKRLTCIADKSSAAVKFINAFLKALTVFSYKSLVHNIKRSAVTLRKLYGIRSACRKMSFFIHTEIFGYKH